MVEIKSIAYVDNRMVGDVLCDSLISKDNK